MRYGREPTANVGAKPSFDDGVFAGMYRLSPEQSIGGIDLRCGDDDRGIWWVGLVEYDVEVCADCGHDRGDLAGIERHPLTCPTPPRWLSLTAGTRIASSKVPTPFLDGRRMPLVTVWLR